MDYKIKCAVETTLEFFRDGYNMRNALMKASNLTGVSMSEIASNLPHRGGKKKISKNNNATPPPKKDWMAKWEDDH